jgi:phosphotransferase system HPr (HPr) family protein
MNYQKVVKIDKVLTILNQRGLHARAAAKFTETIAAFSCEVTVSKKMKLFQEVQLWVY